MESEIVISTDRGWSCSNQAGLDFNHTIERDIEGNPTLVRASKVVQIDNVYNVVDQLQVGDDVECILCLDEEKNVTFVGKVSVVNFKSVTIGIEGEFNEGDCVKDLANKIDKLFN